MMFKLSSYALTTALLTNAAHLATAQCNEGTISEFSGTCSYATFIGGLQNGCTEADFGNKVATITNSELTPQEYVDELCEYDAPTQFVEIQGTYQKDRRYFAGGGDLVDGPDWTIDSARLKRFNDNLGDSTLIAFPEYAARWNYNTDNGLGDNGYPANMNLETSCDLNTIMCCFTDSQMDPFPSDATTDVCRHDLHDSPQSNHIKEGWSVFPGSETPTYCTGFTWTDGDTELLGNMMYDISLKNTIEKGYHSSVPGTPMCGCVEHMPVVEEASCRTATKVGDITYTFTFDGADVSASNSAEITYSDCAEGDLASQFKANQANKDDEAKIDEHLVGFNGCDADLVDYLNDEQFLHQGQHLTKYVTPDPAQWSDLVVGEGIYFMPPAINPEESDAYFRGLIDAGCKNDDESDRPCIVRRVCSTCTSMVHRDIYYKRISTIPDFGDATNGGVYFLDMFMNQWYHEPANVLNTDFELYSTYEDALAGTNKWEHCDYNSSPTEGYGFPRNCGPTRLIGNQWNSYIHGHGSANHHGFYVEKPSTA